MKLKRTSAIAALITLSACAQRPDQIKPTITSDAPYLTLNCTQLTAEYDKINLDLFKAGRAQHARSEKDMFTVMIVGLPPVSRLTDGPDQAPAIADMIGRLDAIDIVAKSKRCSPMAEKASNLHFEDIPPEQDRP